MHVSNVSWLLHVYYNTHKSQISQELHLRQLPLEYHIITYYHNTTPGLERDQVLWILYQRLQKTSCSYQPTNQVLWMEYHIYYQYHSTGSLDHVPPTLPAMDITIELAGMLLGIPPPSHERRWYSREERKGYSTLDGIYCIGNTPSRW